jgi:hypothetical protein
MGVRVCPYDSADLNGRELWHMRRVSVARWQSLFSSVRAMSESPANINGAPKHMWPVRGRSAGPSSY